MDRAATKALPTPCPYGYVLFDHDAKFARDVFGLLQASGIEPMRTVVRSPWQNGVAERWVGSARRDMLDPVIPLNERHLRRLGREYLAYYHEDRTHVGLDKTTPCQAANRTTSYRNEPDPVSTSNRRFHHRYYWAEAA
jgi:hypothetical protein